MSSTVNPTDEKIDFLVDRDLDLVGLKALAHPLRVQLIDTPSTYGSFTASELAEHLGESSGASSNHLRQLETHGFVREVEGEGTCRERWWERLPDSINTGPEEAQASSAGGSATTLIFRWMCHNQARLLTDFVERGVDELPEERLDGAVISKLNTRLTPAQMKEFVGEFMKLADKYVIANKNQNVPNSRPVIVNFHTFPVRDGDVTPDDKTAQNR